MGAEHGAGAEAALSQRFLLDFPTEAARLFEAMPTAEAAAQLALQPPHAVLRCWQAMAPDVALLVLESAEGRVVLPGRVYHDEAIVLIVRDAEA